MLCGMLSPWIPESFEELLFLLVLRSTRALICDFSMTLRL